MSQKILNKRSSVFGKAPLPSQIEVGEIAINFNNENPFLSILDSNGEIQKFLSERKTRGLIQDAKEDIDNSFYTKEEINNMFEAFDPSGEVDLDNYYTKRETDNLLAGKSDSAHTHDYSQILNTPDLSNFATLSDIPSINGLASEVWVGENYQPKGNYLTEHQSLENYYTKSEADGKFLTSHQDLSDYAQKSDLDDYLTIASASTTYATKSEIPDISDLATKSEIPDTSNFITSGYTEEHYQAKGTYVVPSDLNDYALKSELPSIEGLASEEWVSDNFSTTAHTHDYSEIENTPDLSNFATLSDIPSINGLASEVWVGENYQPKGNYLTEHQSLENYYTKSEADNKFLTSHQDLSDYALKSEIPDVSNFVTSAFTDATYAKKGEVPSDAYTKSETDTLLAGKANSAHTHTMSEITDLDVPKTWRGTLAQYNNLTEIDNDTLYIITDSSEQLVTSGDVESMISGYTNLTEVQTLLEGYSTTAHTHSYNDLTDKPTIPSIEGLASEEWVSDNFSTTAHTHDYSEIENTPDLSGFASLSDIPDTSNFITSGFCEDHYQAKGTYVVPSDLNDYALKSEIPSIEGLASEEWVSDNFSTTAHTHDYSEIENTPDLSGFASLSDIPDTSNFITSAFTDATYAKKGEVPSDAYTKAESDSKFQAISAMTGYVTDSELNTTLEGYSTTAHTHSDLATKAELDDYLTIASASTIYATKEELEEFTPSDNYAGTVWTGTLAEYNNLTVIDTDTLYVITDANLQYVTSGDVESMISGYTNLTEVQTLLEGYSTTSHTHSYNDLEDKPTIPSIEGLASETWVSQNFQPQSAMTEYSLSGHTHSQYLTETSADTRYARVVSLTQAQYDALVQNDQVEQGVLYCIIEQSNS